MKQNKATEDDIDRMILLSDSGLGYDEIAAETGFSVSTVSRNCRKYGHPSKKRGGNPNPFKAHKGVNPVELKTTDEKPVYGEVKTYHLSPEEIEDRYGRPGAFAEKPESPIVGVRERSREMDKELKRQPETDEEEPESATENRLIETSDMWTFNDDERRSHHDTERP